jgi:predicted ArsR family transcriptional regulator
MTAPTESRILNYEDAANGLDSLARDILGLARRLDAVANLLRPEWREQFNAIEDMEKIDSPIAEALHKLADDIYRQGERAKDRDI